MNNDIIKMFIEGEEVVSNKEFAINEEMLSASSTILNNCYPASWEETKDYVSNFYYPKDYSKYILGKGNFTYGTDQYSILSVSGETFMQFTTNVEKEWNSFNVYGKSTQATSTQSANLCPPFTDSRWTFTNGVSVTNEGYLSIPANSGARAVINIPWNKSRTCYFKDIIVSGGNAHYAGEYFDESGTLLSSNGKAIFDKDANYQDGTMWGGNNQYGDALIQTTNIKFTIQFSNYTPNPYVIKDLIISENDINYIPFTPNMPSPDYPSELVSVGYKNELYNTATTQTVNGITYTKNDDDSITLNGTATSASYIQISNLIPLHGTFTLSGGERLGSNIYMRGLDYNDNYAVRFNTQPNKSSTATVNSDRFLFYLYVSSNTTVNNVTVYPQLTKGSQVHSYIPYGKYGIEVETVGRNIWDEQWELGLYSIANGSKADSTTNIRSKNYISCLPNTNYYLKANVGNRVCFYDKNKNFISIDFDKQNTIFTTPSNCYYMTFNLGSAYGTTYKNDVCLNISDDKNGEYQPHQSNTLVIELNAPLRSLPNGVKDIAYIKNNILYVDRKVGSIVLDGSDGWGIGSTTYNDLHYFSTSRITDFKKGNPGYATDNFYSNYLHYVSSSNNADLGGAYFINSLFLVFMDFTTVADFRTWLSTHNTQVDYELAEPYTENLGTINLPIAYNGVNNVYFYTGLETDEDINYYWKNYDVLFAGIVKNSGDISLRPTDPKYCSLQILDYKTFLSESDTLDFVISDKTIAEAISMVVDAISGYGFILGTINISQADDVIGAYSTLNKTAYDVFQYLANISGSRWRARFVDSDTMAIDFYDPELLPRANDIDYTQQYWEDNKIVDLTFNYGTRDYRNKQIILSDEVYGGIDYTEVLLSNGYGTSYITQNNIANITSITVNGVKVEVITQSEKDLGVDADFYYTPGKNVVESTTSYSAGTQIIITYTPLVKGRQIVYNDEEVTRIATQTNTTGVISRYENRNDILSSDELENIAETYIKYKGKPEIILKLTTLNNDLFSIGEICYFNSPIADLAQDYMVKSKTTNYTSVAGETNIFYTYELTSSFNSEKAINYFDNQRNKTTGNIAEGESITRNIDINNSAMIIWENATITEISVSVDGDNALNSVLNSPFIQ